MNDGVKKQNKKGEYEKDSQIQKLFRKGSIVNSKGTHMKSKCNASTNKEYDKDCI